MIRPGLILRQAASILPLLMLGWSTSSRADDVAAISDVKHVSWPMENGAPSRIGALGQSRDGYLWIGSVEGLFRFDGVAFENVRTQVASADPMVVSALLGAHSGVLWVGLGRSGGVATYAKGRLVDARMPNPSREVTGIAETADESIWIGRGGRFVHTLARWHGGRWEEIDGSWGLPERRVWQLLVGRDGTLWVVLNDAIVSLPAGGRQFETSRTQVGWRSSIAEDASGRIWVSDAKGVRGVERGGTRAVTTARAPTTSDSFGARILFDRDGRLWATTLSSGLVRVASVQAAANSRLPWARLPAERFASAQGLTSDQARAFFIDREGNLWIGTELGLDMLRPAIVKPARGISANSAESYHIAAASDGVVYVTDADTLYRIPPGGSPEVVLRAPTVPAALCAGRGGSIWLILRDRALHVAGRRVETLRKPPSATYYGCAEDGAGRLWLPAVDQGLQWRGAGGWRNWPGLRPGVGVPGDVAIDAHGRAAILFRARTPPMPGAPFRVVSKERADIGNLESLLPGRRLLMASGSQGLAAFVGERVVRIGRDRSPWLSSVNGLVQTGAGETWTIGDAGIVRMRSADLDAALLGRSSILRHRVFDFNDGLNSFAQKTSGPQVVEGGDGRLWFLTRRNVLTIDPGRIMFNPLAPSVLVKGLSAGERRYRDPVGVHLDAGTTRVAIDYTATSLTVPGRVEFRYRLEGVDHGWVDPHRRRRADYAELGPGSYRFQVIASNNDGVWNRRGAEVRFTIPPTLIQSWSFRALMLAGVVASLWLLYSWRLKHVAAKVRERLETRSAERERIARELHDTLLQGVQGLIMRFHAIAEGLPADDPARTSIDGTLDRAQDLLVEGRERVRDLRTPEVVDLETMLLDLARAQPFSPTTTIEVSSTGGARAVCRPVMQEIGSIAGEALFNAARHAKARRVEVRIVYGLFRLTVIVADNGVGLESATLQQAGSRGHYGVLGMGERADRIGAAFNLRGESGRGTTVTLTIPAALAYGPEAGMPLRRLLASAGSRLPGSRP